MAKGISISLRCWTYKPDKSVEKVILNCPYKWYAARKAYEYARTVLKKRWTAGESLIIQIPDIAYLYSKFVIGGRWKEAEKNIVKDARSAYLYSRYILKGRFPLAEESKCWTNQNVRFIVYYSKYVMKNRWNKYENRISSTPYDVYAKVDYAKNVMKSRWKKIEKYVVDSNLIADYMKILKEKDKEEFYNRVLMEAMTIKPHYHYNYAKRYVESLKQSSDEK